MGEGPAQGGKLWKSSESDGFHRNPHKPGPPLTGCDEFRGCAHAADPSKSMDCDIPATLNKSEVITPFLVTRAGILSHKPSASTPCVFKSGREGERNGGMDF